jgi:hypothetical protein
MPIFDDQQEMVRREVNDYLNNTERRLLPNEERLIKEVVKRYNIFVAAVSFIIILAGIGLVTLAISNLHTTIELSTMDDVIELKSDLAAELETLEKQTESDLKALTRSAASDLAQTIDNARNEVNKTFEQVESDTAYYKRFSSDLLVMLAKDSEKANALQKKIDDLLIRFGECESEVSQKMTVANDKLHELETQLVEIDEKSKTLKEHQWLFDIFKEPYIKQLEINQEENESQYSFCIGELQIVWGQGMTPGKDAWTEITFDRKFEDVSKAAVSIIANEMSDSTSAYPVVKKVKDNIMKFKFVRKKSGRKGYHTAENVKYTYHALGERFRPDF